MRRVNAADLLSAAFVVSALAACGASDGLPPGVELPTNAHGEHHALAAVGLIDRRCSATAIDTGGGENAPAYALSAGHCTSLFAVSEPWIIDHGDPDLGVIAFDDFVDTGAAPVEIAIAEQTYESMDGVDLAVYRLDATVGGLRVRGIDPIALAAAPPAVGDDITIASYPMEIADDPLRVLHVSHCTHEGAVRIAEGPQVFVDFARNDCPSIRPGSSGGAFLDASGALFAVMSTQSNPPGSQGPACYLDVPCEVDTAPANVRAGGVYGSPIRGLASCFPGGTFDLEAPGCTLTRPALPVLRYSDQGLLTDLGRTRWQVTLADMGLPYYRVKAGPATDVRCEADDGYGAPIAIAARSLFDDPIAGPSGAPYVLCIRGEASATPVSPDRFMDRTGFVQLLLP